jgi:outer membrane protein
MILVKKQFLAVIVAVMVCFGFAGATMPSTAMAADTIGFVNFSRVMSSHPNFQSAAAAMNLEEQKAEKEFASKVDKLDQKGQQELRKTLQEKLMKRRQELIEPIQKKALAAIDRAAKAQGVTVVLDQQVIVSGGKDLTNDAAAEIRK